MFIFESVGVQPQNINHPTTFYGFFLGHANHSNLSKPTSYRQKGLLSIELNRCSWDVLGNMQQTSVVSVANSVGQA